MSYNSKDNWQRSRKWLRMDGWSVSEPSFSRHKARHQLQSDAFLHTSAMCLGSHRILYYSIQLHVWGVESINSIIMRKYHWIPDSQVVTVSLFMANVSFADPPSTWQTFSLWKPSGRSRSELCPLKICLTFLRRPYFISTWLTSSLLVTWHFCQFGPTLMSVISCTVAMKLISRLSLWNSRVNKKHYSVKVTSFMIRYCTVNHVIPLSFFNYILVFIMHTPKFWCNISLCMVIIVIKNYLKGSKDFKQYRIEFIFQKCIPDWSSIHYTARLF